MKTAVIPQVRVEPEFRDEIESVLQDGETLSEFVEAAVRRATAFRREQAEFHARGEAAWQAFLKTGETVSTDQVVDTLRSRTEARRKQLVR